jgi:hypothetical protein
MIELQINCFGEKGGVASFENGGGLRSRGRRFALFGRAPSTLRMIEVLCGRWMCGLPTQICCQEEALLGHVSGVGG